MEVGLADIFRHEDLQARAVGFLQRRHCSSSHIVLATGTVFSANLCAQPVRLRAHALTALMVYSVAPAPHPASPPVPHYRATPGQTGLAVNATTLDMVIASLRIAFFARRIDRRMGVVWGLCALAVPAAGFALPQTGSKRLFGSQK